MANKHIDLALAFLQKQPSAAAAVLEQQPIEDVITFIKDVPHTHAALVLEKMLPQYTARICNALEPHVSAGFLSEMRMSLAAAIMRHSNHETRAHLLELLPEKTKIACALLLNYSEDTAGAWMVANIITLPSDCSAQEALSRIAAEHEVLDTDDVYVVDRERQLKGIVNISKLLRAQPKAAITTLMDKNPCKLSGRTSLISVSQNDVWTRKDTVAIINRNQQLVGILRHVDLRKGLDETASNMAQSNASGPLAELCSTYATSLLALFGAVGSVAGTKK